MAQANVKRFDNFECQMARRAYRERLYKRLDEYRADGTLCDLVVITGNDKIPVHKLIMAGCSDYFHAIVTLDMKEKDEKTITLDAIDGVGLRAVVDFAYSGEVDINLDNVSSILQAASYLQILEVVDICEVYLKNVISPDNCLILTPLIELYGINTKYPEVDNYNFMYYNFHEIPEIQRNTMSREQFIAILRDDRLRMSSEFSLLVLVKRWMEFNTECVFNSSSEEIRPDEEPWITFTLLMSEIRWCLISEDEFRDIDAEILAVMNAIPKCRELLREANGYHADLYRQPLMQHSYTQVRGTKQIWVTMPCRTDTHVYTVAPLKPTRQKYNNIQRTSSLNVHLQTAVVFNNFLFVCGGRDGGGRDGGHSSSTCLRYDPRFEKWMDMSPLNVGRRAFVLVAHNKNLYAIGGIQKTSRDESTRTMNACMTSTCERYDIEHNTWSIIPEYNAGIGNHAGCVVNNDIYISGGFPTNTVPIHSQCEVSKYNIATGIWTECAPMAHARSDHVMENIGDVIYVICGRSQIKVEPAWSFVETVERYSIETNQWTNCKQTVRYHNCASFVMDDKIYILGATEHHSNGGQTSEIMIFSEECDNVCEPKLQYLYGCTVKGSALLCIPFQRGNGSQLWFDESDSSDYYCSSDY